MLVSDKMNIDEQEFILKLEYLSKGEAWDIILGILKPENYLSKEDLELFNDL